MRKNTPKVINVADVNEMPPILRNVTPSPADASSERPKNGDRVSTEYAKRLEGKAPETAIQGGTRDLLYSSPIAANAHETMSDLAALGLIGKTTMAEFDASCLTPVAELAAPDIKALREREKVSQGVFAKYLGVAVNTLGQWERGLRRPEGPALKLLALVDRHGLDHIR